MKKRWFPITFITVGCIATVALLTLQKHDTSQPRTYAEIIRSGIIYATTEYNLVGYFIDHDTLAGFHQELFQEFAKSKGLKAKIIPEMDLKTQTDGIRNGKFDVIASSLLITSELKDSILSYSIPILRNRQVLVQRKKNGEEDSLYIHNQIQLGKKTVYLPDNSPIQYRIRNLETEIADTIYIKEIPKYGNEQLLALVAHKDIDYAICEESIAKRMLKYYPQLDISTAISFNQFYGWGVSPNSQELLDTINLWLKDFMQTEKFTFLMKKYIKE